MQKIISPFPTIQATCLNTERCWVLSKVGKSAALRWTSAFLTISRHQTSKDSSPHPFEGTLSQCRSGRLVRQCTDIWSGNATCSVSNVAAACIVEGSPVAATAHRLSHASTAAACSLSNLPSIWVTAARRLHGDDKPPTANSGAALSVAGSDWRWLSCCFSRRSPPCLYLRADAVNTPTVMMS